MFQNEEFPLEDALVQEAKRARVDAYVWRHLLRNRSRAYVELRKDTNRMLEEQEKEIMEELETKNKDLVLSLQEEVEQWRIKAEVLEKKDIEREAQEETQWGDRETLIAEIKRLKKQHQEDEQELLTLRAECNHWCKEHAILRNSNNAQGEGPVASTATMHHRDDLLQEIERWKEEAASWRHEALLWRSKEAEVTGGSNGEKKPKRKVKPQPVGLIEPSPGQTLSAHRQRIFELERELLLQRKRVEKYKTRCVINEEKYKRKIAAHESTFEDLSQALQLYEESLFLKRRTAGNRVTTKGYSGQGTCRTEIDHARTRTTLA